jgi:hypothetical protein
MLKLCKQLLKAPKCIEIWGEEKLKIIFSRKNKKS